MREAPSDGESPADPRVAAIGRDLDRHWLRWTLVAWLAVAGWFMFDRWGPIRWLSLGDTDDNMRLMQVRAWLEGQGWFDLRQYRMNPPQGFDIHWSRLVDLPIAGLILFFRLFTTNGWAERLACGIAPLLPLSVAFVGIGATVRRLVAPLAWPLAIAIVVLSAAATMMMFMPERIDHHGWQLALLSLTLAGLTDERPVRAGLLIGLSTAASLTIGLEMLPYAAIAGAILALRWVWDAREAALLKVYALALGGGSALGYAGFASYADRVPRCDALTPVWLSVMVVAGALLFALAWANPARREARLVVSLVAGAAIAAGFAHFFPQCLGRPEQVSPELVKNWLDNVREAKPIYLHPPRAVLVVVTLPVIGIIGAVVATRRAWGTPLSVPWATVAAFTVSSALLLLWQARAGPAAQLLAVPGAVALAWLVIPHLLASQSALVRVFGTVAAFLVISGVFIGYAIDWLPIDRPSHYTRRVNHASGMCVLAPALTPLDRYPAQTVFTFVDLGPRLITMTHMRAVAGPYHRNGDAILDVQHAFGGTPARAHAIMRAHGATLLLVCPNMAESTVYRTRDRGAFYDQLAHGRRFPWLTQLPLPAGSPLRLFRIS